MSLLPKLRSVVVVMLVAAVMTSASFLVTASVFMPTSTTVQQQRRSFASPTMMTKSHLCTLRLAMRRRQQQQQQSATTSFVSLDALAMAIPGYGVAEQVIVGGFGNFLSIYNLVITGRILLSWFPQAASVGALQPIYAITDPYLNLFRNIIPPVFGLDFSPILAFLLLNVLTNATAAVGCDIPADAAKMISQQNRQHLLLSTYHPTSHEQQPMRRFMAWKTFRNI